MTVDDFLKLVQSPEMVKAKHEHSLKDIVDYYPYFSHARLLYLKALKESGSLLFESRISSTALYVSDRENMFFYLYPEKQLIETPEVYEREERFSGSYFDILDMAEAEGGESPISLKKIAEQLKASRRLIVEEEKSKVPEKTISETRVVSLEKTTKQQKGVLEPRDEKPYIPVPDYFKKEDPTKNMSLEERSKWYIKHKKYPEAIKILKQLYLINPEKSIYFADQIRFLERIIDKSI